MVHLSVSALGTMQLAHLGNGWGVCPSSPKMEKVSIRVVLSVLVGFCSLIYFSKLHFSFRNPASYKQGMFVDCLLQSLSFFFFFLNKPEQQQQNFVAGRCFNFLKVFLFVCF